MLKKTPKITKFQAISSNMLINLQIIWTSVIQTQQSQQRKIKVGENIEESMIFKYNTVDIPGISRNFFS